MNFEGIDVTTVFLADVSNGIYDILSKDQNLTIVKKEQVQNVYSDKQVDISKCETIECALFLAKSVNANKVIVGRVAKIGGQFFIEAKIIDVNDDKNFITENIMTTPDKNIKFVIKELAERFSEKLNSFQKGDISGEDTVKNYDEAKKILNTTYKISVGLNGGYNSLMKGYSGYKNNYSSSLDVKFAIFIDNEPTKWAIRISGELFPMELPEGIYGMYEDIFATHINVLYIFFEDGKINPFLGLGGDITLIGKEWILWLQEKFQKRIHI